MSAPSGGRSIKGWLDGSLVLKIGHEDSTVQILLRDTGYSTPGIQHRVFNTGLESRAANLRLAPIEMTAEG